jgi:carboxypeptidase T
MNLKWDKYHAHDFAGDASIPTWDGTSTEMKSFNSLKADLDELRTLGSGKGIVDSGTTSVGTSYEGRDLLAIKVGKGSGTKVLFTGCHHAREWISVEIVFLMAEYLVRAYSDSPSAVQDKRLQWLVDNREIWFVPMVNPDGHNWTRTVNRQWRPGRTVHELPAGDFYPPRLDGGPPRHVKYPAGSYTGVDLNRNYATSTWGKETFHPGSMVPATSGNPKDAGPNSVWFGPSAASEPEVVAIQTLVQGQSFRSAITYHSFSQFLLYPQAAKDDTYLQFVGKGMKTLIAEKGNPYEYGYSGDGGIIYAATGDAMLYAYEQMSKRPSFTPELRPTQADGDRWGFNQLPEDQIEGCFRENVAAALALIQCAGFDAPSGPRVTPSLTIGSQTQVKLDVMPNCWKVFSNWTV